MDQGVCCFLPVVNTLAKLREALPWELKSSLEPLDLNRLVAHWRSAYEEIFEVIDISGDAARKALAREAMALPPAKATTDRSEGGRDAAVWFSIREYLEENPDEEVCFVTNNTKDFGDGATYPYPMNEDVRGLEGRLTRLTDFDAVVSKFAKEVSGRDAEAAAEELLRSLSVRDRVSRTAVEVLSSPVGFVGLDTAQASVQWRQWLTSPEAELLSIADVLGHEIEGSVWYTANTRWLLHGVAINGDDEDVRYVSCVWEMKVLFSANGGDEAPTLLTPGASNSCWPNNAATARPSRSPSKDQTLRTSLGHGYAPPTEPGHRYTTAGFPSEQPHREASRWDVRHRAGKRAGLSPSHG
ncbi:PIN domain-containing protein [Streptomyces xanthophaeus]